MEESAAADRLKSSDLTPSGHVAQSTGGQCLQGPLPALPTAAGTHLGRGLGGRRRSLWRLDGVRGLRLRALQLGLHVLSQGLQIPLAFVLVDLCEGRATKKRGQ